MSEKEVNQEYINEEMINEYLTQYTYINIDGTVSKSKTKYFVKD